MHTSGTIRISLLREITLSDWHRERKQEEEGLRETRGKMFQALCAFISWPQHNTNWKAEVMYWWIIAWKAHSLCPGTFKWLVSWMWMCSGNKIGCQFQGYFVLYTNLSFKDMSWIGRAAYNRWHNMRSHMLMHTTHSVGIISPAFACGCTLRSAHTSQYRRDIRQSISVHTCTIWVAEM